MRELIAKPGRWWIALNWLWIMLCACLFRPTYAPSLVEYIELIVFAVMPALATLWLKTVYLYLRRRL